MRHLFQVFYAIQLVFLSGCVRAGVIGQLSDSGPINNGDGSRGESLSADSQCAAGPFGAPALLPNVNAQGEDDWLPTISADGLELVFNSWRVGGTGKSDLWRATRTSINADFSSPQPITELNSAESEFDPWLSDDGRTLLFVSNREQDHYAIYVSTRSAPEAPFSTPTELTELRTVDLDDDWAPVLVDQGRRLYFSSMRPGSKGDLDIWITTRSDTSSPFGAPVNLSSINSAAEDRIETLSSDGSELYFSSNREGGKGLRDLYVVKLAAPDSAQGEPQNLAPLNTSFDDLGAALTPDGRGILLNRDTQWNGGRDSNIWISWRSCTP
jgi:hypothetical protein